MISTRVKDFLLGVTVGIILICILSILLSAFVQTNKNNETISQEPNNIIAPIPKSNLSYEDEKLASDILSTSKKLQDLLSQVNEEISYGDLNGAMLTLNLEYTKEMSNASSRAVMYYISPKGKNMQDAWNGYLNELPMVFYYTLMEIEDYGKNYYAKANADNITADKFQIAADYNLTIAIHEAEKINQNLDNIKY